MNWKAEVENSTAIGVGDKVTVVFDGVYHPFFVSDNGLATHRLNHVEILYTPCDVGDHYRLRTKDGVVFTVNPACSAFVGLIKE